MKSSILRRAGARFIDGLILTVIGVAWGLPMHFRPDWLVIHALIVYAYFVVSDVQFGKTPGKAVLGLKVTSGDGGSNPTWKEAMMREVFVLAGAVPFVGPFLALGCWIGIGVTANRDPLDRGFHDEWAGGTRVVSLG